MTEYCSKCGEPLKDEALFCANCGEKVPNRHNKFSNKYLILIVIAVIALAAIGSAFLFFNQAQTVQVDNVEFEIPADYVSVPSRNNVEYDGNIESTSMGWSNDKYYIEIGIVKTPGKGIDSDKVASTIGGTPHKLFGYSGYYLDYGNEGCGFVFGLRDEVCMVYATDYDAFKDIKVIGQK
ncbi:MAG: zinc-ribbon domain-containing protein [Methanobrevibacter sp.]|nr:zinc-ribbon domain-containing protein [Methanobrevibacter sp.]